MMFAEDIINPVIRKYPCSGAWTIPISSLDKREREYFPRFSPAARTAVVLGYHIVTKYEWTWFEKENGLHHCHADDHSKKIYNDIADAFGVHGFRTAMVPYPGESGIQFRSVAQSAGAGEIGMNTFLLHPFWGPWIQTEPPRHGCTFKGHPGISQIRLHPMRRVCFSMPGGSNPAGFI